MRAYPNSPRSRAVIQCRGRGSNPHGAFAPEDFKSFDYDEKLFVLLALFRPNVKVCNFMCKFCKTASKIRPILSRLFETVPRIRILPAQSIK